MGALVYIYMRHNSSFYFVRNMFAVAMWTANLGFMLFPTAPPRFFPEWGFTDSVANLTHVGHDSVAVNRWSTSTPRYPRCTSRSR